MGSSKPASQRAHYVAVARFVAPDAWHITIRELPGTWTVAFVADVLESRARAQIGNDLGVDPGSFDLTLELPGGLRLERRAHRRD